ncbi:unnamed protein product [Withania somnifera]
MNNMISVIKRAFGTIVLAFQGHIVVIHGDFSYQDALTKSIIYFLENFQLNIGPSRWKIVDLVGGYYDAGDNVKYGLPMAFTVTTLAWAAIAYHSQLQAAGELENVRSAISSLIYEVGDSLKDHECWTRPENMKTPRTTSAEMASASILFCGTNRSYACQLLNKARLLFQFAKTHKGTYDGECPFYCSFSGYQDELLWAATWLYTATRRTTYLEFITEEATTATVAEFSWDLKYAGVQILLSKFYIEGEKDLQNFKQQADGFVCSNLPQSPYHQVHASPGGLIHLSDGANSQYVTGTAFLFSDYLATHKQKVSCGNKQFDSADLMAFAKQQMEYLLGKNPRGKSYMVGLGTNLQLKLIVEVPLVPKMSLDKLVDCSMSFVSNSAIVGGADKYDNFDDRRSSSSMTEPTTYTNSLVGVLAKLAKHHARALIT